MVEECGEMCVCGDDGQFSFSKGLRWVYVYIYTYMCVCIVHNIHICVFVYDRCPMMSPMSSMILF